MLSTALFALVSCGAGLAQDQPSRLELFVEGGGSFFPANQRQATLAATSPLGSTLSLNPGALTEFSNSGRLFLGLRYRLTANNALEASYSASNSRALATGATEGGPFCPGSGTVVLSRYLEFGSLNYVRYFPTRGRIHPFATGGFGIASFSGCFAELGDAEPAANFGGGADIALNERLSIRAEVRDFVVRLPRPLRGTAHNLAPSAGVVLGLRSPSKAPDRFPRLQFFAEAGLSFLTAATNRQIVAVGSEGGQLQYRTRVERSYFSKAGRSLVGLRAFLTRNNAVEGAWSYAPNRYTLGGAFEPPLGPEVRTELTQWFHNFSADYVRSLPIHGRLEPFLAAGLGLARYSGVTEDINKFSVNFGGGTDVRLNRLLALRFEFRDFTAGQPDPITGMTHNLAPTAGLVFSFQ